MPIGLVVRWIEKWTHVVRRRPRDPLRRHHPEVDSFIPTGVYVPRVQQRLLCIDGVNASAMFMRSAGPGLNENLPERPLRISRRRVSLAWLRHRQAAAPFERRLAAYASAAARTQ